MNAFGYHCEMKLCQISCYLKAVLGREEKKLELCYRSPHLPRFILAVSNQFGLCIGLETRHVAHKFAGKHQVVGFEMTLQTLMDGQGVCFGLQTGNDLKFHIIYLQMVRVCLTH